MSNETPSKSTPIQTAPPTPQQVAELLDKVNKLEAKVETKADAPKAASQEIDWTKITEKEVFDLNFPIPVIEHELPEYMTVHVKDNNYIVRWANTNRKRLGTLMATGYSYFEKQDWDTNYPNILGFNAEGHLVYDDVVAVKILKALYFSDLRRTHLKATQINNVSGFAKVKGEVNKLIQSDLGLEKAVGRGSMAFYGETVSSNIEQISGKGA